MKIKIVLLVTMLAVSLFNCTAMAEYGLESNAWNSYNNCIARGEYDAAISMYPEQARAYWYRGRSEIWHSQWDDAIADMNFCVKRDYSLTDTWFYLGRGYAGKFSDNPETSDFGNQAVNYFSKTIQRDASYGNAYFFRAGVFAQQGQLDQARADYQKFLSLKNDNTDSSLNKYALAQLGILNNNPAQ